LAAVSEAILGSGAVDEALGGLPLPVVYADEPDKSDRRRLVTVIGQPDVLSRQRCSALVDAAEDFQSHVLQIAQLNDRETIALECGLIDCRQFVETAARVMDTVGGNVRRVARRDEFELAPVILLQRGESLLAVDHLIEFDAIGAEPHLEEECWDGQVVDDGFNEQ